MVQRDKEFQVWREQKKPNAQPGFSDGKLSGRSREEGREKVENEVEGRERLMENELMSLGMLYQRPKEQTLERILSATMGSELGGRMG